MGEDLDKVKHIIKISQDTVSLETSVGDDDDDDSSLADFIQDVKNVSPSHAAGVELLKDYIEEAISDLSPREQKILEMRFGLKDGVTHTLEEVGKEFDVTRERIRQIEAKALEKIAGFGIIEKLRDYQITQHITRNKKGLRCEFFFVWEMSQPIPNPSLKKGRELTAEYNFYKKVLPR